MDRELLLRKLNRQLRRLGFAWDQKLITQEEYSQREKEILDKLKALDEGKEFILHEPIAAREGKYRLELISPGCIACGACGKMNPLDWMWNDNEKAELVGGEKVVGKSGTIVKERKFIDNLRNNLLVAECCPVKVIHVYNHKTNERLWPKKIISDSS